MTQMSGKMASSFLFTAPEERNLILVSRGFHKHSNHGRKHTQTQNKHSFMTEMLVLRPEHACAYPLVFCTIPAVVEIGQEKLETPKKVLTIFRFRFSQSQLWQKG